MKDSKPSGAPSVATKDLAELRLLARRVVNAQSVLGGIDFEIVMAEQRRASAREALAREHGELRSAIDRVSSSSGVPAGVIVARLNES